MTSMMWFWHLTRPHEASQGDPGGGLVRYLKDEETERAFKVYLKGQEKG